MTAMHPSSKAAFACCLATGIMLFSACSRRISIESINHDPGQFRDHEITVAGRVANSFVSGNVSAFEIDDGTGRLWVFRDSTKVPIRNSSMKVTGIIAQGFPFAGRNFVITLRETQKED